MRSLDANGNLSQVCFELFKRFIVYDSGSIRKDILSFISSCLYPMMTKDEIRLFSFRVIEEFLSTSQSTFS